MDNIGDISGLVVTGIRQPRGWESHSHPVGSSSDRVDIQRGDWTSFSLVPIVVIHHTPAALPQKSEPDLDTVRTTSR